MEYEINVFDVWECGQRKDEYGVPHQEDYIFPHHDEATPEDCLFILCDGMGGHDAGEVASQTVCETMAQYIEDNAEDAETPLSDDILQQAVSAALDQLDAKDTGAVKKMGTTMTMLHLHREGATIAHIGDSRVYHLRPGKDAADTKILFRTRDHSLVNDLVRLGEMTPEEARVSDRRNVLSRAMLPNMEHRAHADIYRTSDIKSGDYFYLCSDGMLENMEDEQLCYHFSHAAGDDKAKQDNLVRATAENIDNHSAIIIHILDTDACHDGPISSLKRRIKSFFGL